MPKQENTNDQLIFKYIQLYTKFRLRKNKFLKWSILLIITFD